MGEYHRATNVRHCSTQKYHTTCHLKHLPLEVKKYYSFPWSITQSPYSSPKPFSPWSHIGYKSTKLFFFHATEQIKAILLRRFIPQYVLVLFRLASCPLNSSTDAAPMPSHLPYSSWHAPLSPLHLSKSHSVKLRPSSTSKMLAPNPPILPDIFLENSMYNTTYYWRLIFSLALFADHFVEVILTSSRRRVII